ncbi:MAG: hypothetical protein BWY78_00098 [Alphaproteobacteria bacterium ADurb.Bin438]|nr:MAG: hypothetical protein BWY78_00098 [Alphaproteobacteria bacterium ADurb.Bin438]
MISSLSNNHASMMKSIANARNVMQDAYKVKSKEYKIEPINLFEDSSETSANGVSDKYSLSKVSELKEKFTQEILGEKGLTSQKLNSMPLSEKMLLQSEISEEIQSRMKSFIKSDVNSVNNVGFLRGEMLSNKVISTLLFAV